MTLVMTATSQEFPAFVWRPESKEFTPLVTLGKRKNREMQLKVTQDKANTKKILQFH